MIKKEKRLIVLCRTCNTVMFFAGYDNKCEVYTCKICSYSIGVKK